MVETHVVGTVRCRDSVGDTTDIGKALNGVAIDLVDDPAGLASGVYSGSSGDYGRGGGKDRTGSANVNALRAGRNRDSGICRGLLCCGDLRGVVGCRQCDLARV